MNSSGWNHRNTLICQTALLTKYALKTIASLSGLSFPAAASRGTQFTTVLVLFSYFWAIPTTIASEGTQSFSIVLYFPNNRAMFKRSQLIVSHGSMAFHRNFHPKYAR
ncbi:hypothetical protein F4811DRAFT_530398 [Daldinia bambusicola]|nr:hypothetical protein F4811DRAFT_530398 [Daldinia bambusicola]